MSCMRPNAKDLEEAGELVTEAEANARALPIQAGQAQIELAKAKALLREALLQLDAKRVSTLVAQIETFLTKSCFPIITASLLAWISPVFLWGVAVWWMV